MLDYRIGIIDAHVFVSTNYISFLAGISTQKKASVRTSSSPIISSFNHLQS
jgi:hypothetical protein